MNFYWICISLFASCIFSVCAVPSPSREIISTSSHDSVKDGAFEEKIIQLEKDPLVHNDETAEVKDNKTTKKFGDEPSLVLQQNQLSMIGHIALEAEDMEESEIRSKNNESSTLAPEKSTVSGNPINHSVVNGTSIRDFRNETVPLKFFPNDSSIVASIETYPSDFQRKLNHGNSEYSTDIISSSSPQISEIPPEISTDASFAVIGLPTTQQNSGITSEIISQPLETREKMVAESSSFNNAESNTEKSTMRAGFIAAFAGISFAIFSLIAYISIVAWKSYLEYRYGNRELLVNDFDANDINNFEL